MRKKKEEPILRIKTINIPVRNRLQAMQLAEKTNPGWEAVTWRQGKKKTINVLLQTRQKKEKDRKVPFRPISPWRSATRKAINELRNLSHQNPYRETGPWISKGFNVDDDEVKKEAFKQAREDTKTRSLAKNKVVRRQLNKEKEITRRVQRLQKLLLINIVRRASKISLGIVPTEQFPRISHVRYWYLTVDGKPRGIKYTDSREAIDAKHYQTFIRHLPLVIYPIIAQVGSKTGKTSFDQSRPFLPAITIVTCCKCGKRTRKYICPRCGHNTCTSCK